jgi:hypothetical protein
MAEQPEEKEKKVTITQGKPPKVIPNVIHLERHKGQEIEWVCADPNFEVRFNESPFGHWRYRRDFPKSGPVVVCLHPLTTKTYKYSVEAWGQTVDPEVEIIP